MSSEIVSLCVHNDKFGAPELFVNISTG